MSATLLAPQEARLFQRLRLQPRRAVRGAVRGERVSRQKGTSIDFSDFREYAPGDDLRHMDWNVYARLDTPVVKTYDDEADLVLHLLVDCSKSMNFGEPTKFASSCKIAAGFALSATNGGDGVCPSWIGTSGREARVFRGRSGFVRACVALSTATPDGTSPLGEGVRGFLARNHRPGLVALLTDGLDPNFSSLAAPIAAQGHELWVVQTLDPAEMRPDLEGDLRLIDSETGADVEITANSITFKEYGQRLNAHLKSVKAEVQRVGGRWCQYTSGTPLDSLVSGTFRAEGWLA